MKAWTKPEITTLELKCTESGVDKTPYQDDVRQDDTDPNKKWYSFSGIND